MDEIRDWLQLHDGSLSTIAERLGLEISSVRAAAALVLEGYTDDDDVEAIRTQIVAMDSQEHPVRNVPRWCSKCVACSPTQTPTRRGLEHHVLPERHL